MIGMGVGDQDVGDGFFRKAREQGIHVIRQHRAGIDDRHLSPADDVGAGSRSCEGSGIARHDPPDAIGHGLDYSVTELEFVVERDAGHVIPAVVGRNFRAGRPARRGSRCRVPRTGSPRQAR